MLGKAHESRVMLVILENRSITSVCLQPGGIAGREMPKLVYSKDSVYARVADVGTVKAVTRRDLEDFHAANFR